VAFKKRVILDLCPELFNASSLTILEVGYGVVWDESAVLLRASTEDTRTFSKQVFWLLGGSMLC